MKKKMIFPLKIILPIVTPSGNRFIRMHYREKHKLLGVCNDWLTAAGARDPKFRAEENGRRRVEIRSFRQNILDYDNLVAGCKPLIDALQHHRLIWDDRPEFLDLEISQEIDRRYKRTEIIIFEVR
jgi:hypothetical protein